MQALTRILLLLASVIVSLLLAEVVVRVAGLGPHVKVMWVSNDETVYKRSDNPILGVELKAGYRNPDADLNESYPRTNAHGQRDVERSLEPRPGVRRILLLGDSVVEGHGIREIDDTLSRRLEQGFDGDTEVLNFGVSGYNTRAEVELLRVKGLRFAPDLVVLVFTANDYDNFLREAFELGSERSRPAWAKRLFSVSELFQLASVRLDWWGLRSDADPLARSREALAGNNVAEGLALLGELAREHGFGAIVTVWPEFTDAGVVDPHPMPDGAGTLVVERLADASGLSTFRLSPTFRDELEARAEPTNPRQLYTLGDGLHPSLEGTRIGARALRQVIDGFDPERHAVRPPGDPDAAAARAALGLSDEKPTYAALESNRASKLYEEGRFAESEAAARRALEEEPGLANAHYNLGMALAAQGRHAEAMAALRAATGLDANHAEAWNAMGLALAHLGRLPEAEQAFRRALQVDADYVVAMGNLGTALREQGRLPDAVRAYRAALALDPGYADAHSNLGLVLFQRGDTEGALRHFARLAELRPSDADAAANHAAALHAAGRLDEAAAEYRRALALNPAQQAARQNLAALEAAR